MTTTATDEQQEQLEQLRDEIRRREAELEDLREQRNAAIIALRKKDKKLTQGVLAALAGVGQSYVARVIAFKGRPPHGYSGDGTRQRQKAEADDDE